MPKPVPDVLARIVLVLLFAFSAYRAAVAHLADELPSVLYNLGVMCVVASMLTRPGGQLLPPRKATIADVAGKLRAGTLQRMTRLQTGCSVLGFALLMAAIFAKWG